MLDPLSLLRSPGARALFAALRDPELRAALERFAARLRDGRADYERLHWGSRGRGPVDLELPSPPDRFVVLGALSRVGYLTKKDEAEPTEYVHCFGDEVEPDTFQGPRPRLVVGFYNDDRPAELFIVRGNSDFDVTTHGIEG